MLTSTSLHRFTKAPNKLSNYSIIIDSSLTLEPLMEAHSALGIDQKREKQTEFEA